MKLTDKLIIEALNKGKKIKKRNWGNLLFFYSIVPNTWIYDNNKNKIHLCTSILEAEDWEIIE